MSNVPSTRVVNHTVDDSPVRMLERTAAECLPAVSESTAHGSVTSIDMSHSQLAPFDAPPQQQQQQRRQLSEEAAGTPQRHTTLGDAAAGVAGTPTGPDDTEYTIHITAAATPDTESEIENHEGSFYASLLVAQQRQRRRSRLCEREEAALPPLPLDGAAPRRRDRTRSLPNAGEHELTPSWSAATDGAESTQRGGGRGRHKRRWSASAVDASHAPLPSPPATLHEFLTWRQRLVEARLEGGGEGQTAHSTALPSPPPGTGVPQRCGREEPRLSCGAGHACRSRAHLSPLTRPSLARRIYAACSGPPSPLCLREATRMATTPAGSPRLPLPTSPSCDILVCQCDEDGEDDDTALSEIGERRRLYGGVADHSWVGQGLLLLLFIFIVSLVFEAPYLPGGAWAYV
ncbi:hypothetical protein NESM_000783800 [Novymonas esmeraldas]|uniref:Uncharacterized protein n=1 Tax=Novymonas esmeraldas TaxID=1808958 RepID=A0AAW0EVY2_9TRYP